MNQSQPMQRMVVPLQTVSTVQQPVPVVQTIDLSYERIVRLIKECKAIRQYPPGSHVHPQNVVAFNTFWGGYKYGWAEWRKMVESSMKASTQAFIATTTLHQDCARQAKDVIMDNERVWIDDGKKVDNVPYNAMLYGSPQEASLELGAVMGTIVTATKVVKGTLNMADETHIKSVTLSVPDSIQTEFNQKLIALKREPLPLATYPLVSPALGISHVLEVIQTKDVADKFLETKSGPQQVEAIYSLLRSADTKKLQTAITSMNKAMYHPALSPSFAPMADIPGSKIQIKPLNGQASIGSLVPEARDAELSHYFMKSKIDNDLGSDKSAKMAWYRSTNYGIVVPHSVTKLALTIAIIGSCIKKAEGKFEIDVTMDSLSDIPTILSSLRKHFNSLDGLKFVVSEFRNPHRSESYDYIITNRRPKSFYIHLDHGPPSWSPSATSKVGWIDSLAATLTYTDSFLVYLPWVSASTFPDYGVLQKKLHLEKMVPRRVHNYVLDNWDNYHVIMTSMENFQLMMPYIKWENDNDHPTTELKDSGYLKYITSYDNYRTHLTVQCSRLLHRAYTRTRKFVPLYNWLSYNKRQLRTSYIDEDGNYNGNYDAHHFLPPTIDTPEAEFNLFADNAPETMQHIAQQAAIAGVEDDLLALNNPVQVDNENN